MTAGVRGAAGLLGRLARLPQRGVWSHPGRMYIEVRGVHGTGGERVARRVERALETHPRVRWARVNAPSERVVVSLLSQAVREAELVALVEQGEEAEAAAVAEEFDEWLPEPHHPSEGPSTPESLSALTADAVGLTLSTALRLAPWLKLPTEVGALASLLQHHPRIRRLAAAVSGPDRADSALTAVSALAQGVATRGGGLALDVVERLAQWREAAAERQAWEAAEPHLVHGPRDVAAEPIVVERPGPPPGTRPRATPSGPCASARPSARSPHPSQGPAAAWPWRWPRCRRRRARAGRASPPASATSSPCAAWWPWTAARCAGWARWTPW
ncbi:P-type HAD superfamily ATPase, partial [Streptomyces sparsogenes DSM 40356]